MRLNARTLYAQKYIVCYHPTRHRTAHHAIQYVAVDIIFIYFMLNREHLSYCNPFRTSPYDKKTAAARHARYSKTRTSKLASENMLLSTVLDLFNQTKSTLYTYSCAHSHCCMYNSTRNRTEYSTKSVHFCFDWLWRVAVYFVFTN